MNILNHLKQFFKGGKKLTEKSFQEIVSNAGGDWGRQGMSIDAEVFQNQFSLKAAAWDLWRCNAYVGKYAEQLASNVYGEAGIFMRSKIVEETDRVVYAPDEKWALIKHEERINRVREWAEKNTGNSIAKYRAFKLADALDDMQSRSHEAILRGTAIIEVGQSDVYANLRVEGWWQDFQQAKFCDVRGRRTYNGLRQIRLWGAARDGGHFIRLIEDSKVNEMGFSLQHINDEWVDYFYNVPDTGNGTTIRLGIEYPFTSWGIGKPVAYYFIKRQQRDWQSGAVTRRGYGGTNSYATHDRVPAEQIIHFARFTDTEGTRPAPWGVGAIAKVRQLDQYEVAEVVAARMGACLTGWLYSDILPEGGIGAIPGNAVNTAKGMSLVPGGVYGLPYGVKYEGHSPSHPSGNFEDFRKGMLRSIAAAFPGADYNSLGNDLEGISFSAGRLGRLDSNEIWKMLQKWDIDTAERPIFERGLEMALITGYLPFTYSKAKFAKLNKPRFQGRRWAQVDEVKAVSAAALRIANKLSNRNRECADAGVDFEDNALELAEEEMLMESLGLTTGTSEDAKPAAKKPEPDDEDEDEDEEEVDNPPKK